MIKTLRLVAARGAMLAGAIVISASAFAQAPTDAQREAIRSACRSDYMAHCSSVPPGGLESLQCLQKNMSSLSGSCKSAVNAVEAPAAPAAKSEAPAAAPKAETPAAAEPAKPAATAAPAAAPKAAASRPPKNLPTRRLPRSAAPADPTIQKSVRACRPAAHRRCNAWIKTNRKSRQAVSRRSTPPAVALRLRRREVRPRAPARFGRGTGRRSACSDRAAADAPARGIVRAALGLRRRCSLAMRRGRARRRPHRAMPRHQRGVAVAGVQGCAEPVQGAVKRQRRRPGERRDPYDAVSRFRRGR